VFSGEPAELLGIRGVQHDASAVAAAKALLQFFAKKKWVVIERQRPASAIPLPATWEEYLEFLSAKERGKIAYYSKRLEKKNIEHVSINAKANPNCLPVWKRYLACIGSAGRVQASREASSQPPGASSITTWEACFWREACWNSGFWI